MSASVTIRVALSIVYAHNFGFAPRLLVLVGRASAAALGNLLNAMLTTIGYKLCLEPKERG